MSLTGIVGNETHLWIEVDEVIRNLDNDRLFETYDGIPQYILNMTSEELDVAIAKEKKRVEELNKLEHERK